MTAKQSGAMDKALKLVARGRTPAEAAERCGLNPVSVRRAMRRAGMKVRKPGRPKVVWTSTAPGLAAPSFKGTIKYKVKGKYVRKGDLVTFVMPRVRLKK
jgi:hypothetical protein